MIPPGFDVFVATEPVDLRFGFERLGGLVRDWMLREPRTRGAYAVFCGKRRNAVKILAFDGTGTILWYKRLDKGVFEIPRPERDGERSVVVSAAMFETMFSGFRRTVH